jgi:hypothetical protein
MRELTRPCACLQSSGSSPPVSRLSRRPQTASSILSDPARGPVEHIRPEPSYFSRRDSATTTTTTDSDDDADRAAAAAEREALLRRLRAGEPAQDACFVTRAGRRYHAFGEGVPYPRSYDRELLDLCVSVLSFIGVGTSG